MAFFASLQGLEKVFIRAHLSLSGYKRATLRGEFENIEILSYFEDVRVRYLSSLSIDINNQSESNSVILASMKIDYYHQVSYPDIFDVGCRIIRIGTKSFDLLSSIFLKDHDKTLVSGLFTIVCFDYVEQKTIVVPNVIKNQLNPIVDKI